MRYTYDDVIIDPGLVRNGDVGYFGRNALSALEKANSTAPPKKLIKVELDRYAPFLDQEGGHFSCFIRMRS